MASFRIIEHRFCALFIINEQILRLWYNSIASASTGFAPNALALFNSRRVAPTVYPGGREQAGRGFAVSIATWRVYRRPGQPGGSFTGRRNAPAFTSASTPALSGKTVERWVDPLGLHFTKTLCQQWYHAHWVYLVPFSLIRLTCHAPYNAS